MKTFKIKAALPGTPKGFTLIEILIAMAIFSIGILSVASLLMSSMHNNTNANFVTEATMLARAKMEELKLNPEADDEETIGIYTLRWESNPSDPALLREISVSVEWYRGGRNRSVVLKTQHKGL